MQSFLNSLQLPACGLPWVGGSPKFTLSGVFNSSVSVACPNLKIKWEGGKTKKDQRTFPLKGDETSVETLENRSWPESLPDMIYPLSRRQLRVWGRWRFLTVPYPHINALPGLIHHCAVKIPPPPAPLFSQNWVQIKEHTAVLFSL